MTRTSTPTPLTQHAVSGDGTRIAYEAGGTGPALVLVDGALCQRAMGPARGLMKELSGSFTVHAYDRRGRGDSGPGASPYDVAREVEDLAAVIEAAAGACGRPVHVFAASSGAALALEAQRQGVAIDRLVTYEAPFIVDDTHAAHDPGLPDRVRGLVESGSRGEAVKTFLRTVGVPAPILALMPLMPAWKQMAAVAHTLPYDLSIVVPHGQGTPLPDGYYDEVGAETLVLVGGKSPEYMRNAQAAVAAAVPGARLETLRGQTHMIKPKVVAPVVTSFLLG